MITMVRRSIAAAAGRTGAGLPSRSRDCCKTPFAVSLSNRFPFLLKEEKAFDKLRPNGFV
jgi:hypothetical protein